MEAKRILHVTDGMDIGGIETFIMNIYRNINRKKIQFDFLIYWPNKCDYEDEILSLGGRVYRTVLKRQGFLKFIQSTNSILDELPDYDIAHIHVSSLIAALSWLPTKLRRIPIKIFHSHNTASAGDINGVAKKIGQSLLNTNSEYLFACSEAAGQWMFGDKLLRGDKFMVINNGIDTQKFFYDEGIRKQTRSSLNIENKFVIGHIGSFRKQKNHEFIIDVFNQIYRKDNTSILLLVGNGGLETNIKNKVKTLGLENAVVFLGLRDDVNSLLNSMDIFLLPSLYEGLPVVGIEAQTTGIKCFFSSEITKEVDITGLIEFVSLDKPTEFWAEEIIKYKNRQRLNAKELIVNNDYDIKGVVDKLSTLYLQQGGRSI